MTTAQELANRMVQRVVDELIATCEPDIIERVNKLVDNLDEEALLELILLHDEVLGDPEPAPWERNHMASKYRDL